MSYDKFFTIKPLALLAFAVAAAGCSESAPPPVKLMSYAQDVKPVLEKHCIECHTSGGAGTQKSGFDMSSYESVMKGTKFGPVIVAGDSVSSTLVILVEGRADSSLKMPHGDRQPLSKEETDTLRKWIDQGAKNN
ncbi:MAG: hypothetical protein GY862_37280 [Gammaproteobacteria bacterium]|nr:hypothetical protein [Gammaproteobacteria bacterium]